MPLRKLGLITLASSLALGLSSGIAFAQNDAKQDIKNAGTETKNASKDAGHGIAKGSKKAYHSTAHGTKVAADKTADARKFDELSYIEVLNRELKVMDSTAISLCMDNNLPIIVFNLMEKGNIKRVVSGEPIGTLVSGGRR